MPSRIVREGILTSERVNALSPNAELFYRRLMSVVDDFGRYTANLTLLRASCYPLKLDSVKEDSISKHLAECVGARLIVLYMVADKAFLELQDFRQQVRAKDSKYPAPEDHMQNTCVADDSHLITDVHLCGDGVVDEDGGDRGAAFALQSSPVDAPFIEIAINTGAGFPVSMASVEEFSKLYPAVDVKQELRSMKAWAMSNPAKRKTQSGMMRFINSWLSKAQNQAPSRQGAAPAPQKGALPRLSA